MNRQAIVGLFTILALLGLFGVFFVLTNVGTQGRYKIAVHFKSAAGLHKGALVYESGVVVGMLIVIVSPVALELIVVITDVTGFIFAVADANRVSRIGKGACRPRKRQDEAGQYCRAGDFLPCTVRFDG